MWYSRPYTSIIAVALLSFVLSGCNLFSTRTPEPPAGNTTSFLQPTSELIVLQNFQSSISDKSTENFLLCLSDTAQSAKQQFKFEPSAEAGARYADLFARWVLQNERQAFFSMISKLTSGTKPSLELNNGRFDIRVPDSAVYVADYRLSIPHTVSTIPTLATGTLRLTIVPNQFNQWSIQRWVDQRTTAADSTTASWSTLKAQFVN
ncbi:MAG: hypothetical protein JNL32_09170 [Candidatus Kapabacteria bacterium]|nr:hypothetical protein [Candidatus Kapabacteria bacterium]